MKILIIEDEKDLREVMTRSLEKERFVVDSGRLFYSPAKDQ